jgi:hypothetical protein
VTDVESLRQLLHVEVTEAEAEAVLASYLALSRAAAALPVELREIEPALRSIPGPPRQ